MGRRIETAANVQFHDEAMRVPTRCQQLPLDGHRMRRPQAHVEATALSKGQRPRPVCEHCALMKEHRGTWVDASCAVECHDVEWWDNRLVATPQLELRACLHHEKVGRRQVLHLRIISEEKATLLDDVSAD